MPDRRSWADSTARLVTWGQFALSWVQFNRDLCCPSACIDTGPTKNLFHKRSLSTWSATFNVQCRELRERNVVESDIKDTKIRLSAQKNEKKEMTSRSSWGRSRRQERREQVICPLVRSLCFVKGYIFNTSCPSCKKFNIEISVSLHGHFSLGTWQKSQHGRWVGLQSASCCCTGLLAWLRMWKQEDSEKLLSKSALIKSSATAFYTQITTMPANLFLTSLYEQVKAVKVRIQSNVTGRAPCPGPEACVPGQYSTYKGWISNQWTSDFLPYKM